MFYNFFEIFFLGSLNIYKGEYPHRETPINDQLKLKIVNTYMRTNLNFFVAKSFDEEHRIA